MINGDGFDWVIKWCYRLLIAGVLFMPFGIWKVLELLGVL